MKGNSTVITTITMKKWKGNITSEKKETCLRGRRRWYSERARFDIKSCLIPETSPPGLSYVLLSLTFHVRLLTWVILHGIIDFSALDSYFSTWALLGVSWPSPFITVCLSDFLYFPTILYYPWYDISMNEINIILSFVCMLISHALCLGSPHSFVALNSVVHRFVCF